MAYKISISSVEAELVERSGIPGLMGGFFSFEPKNALALITQITATEDPDRAAETFTGRLATLHGQWLHENRQTADQAVIVMADEGIVDDFFAAIPVVEVPEVAEVVSDEDTTEQPDQAGDEPVAATEAPRRGRRSA